jgi:signal peptide peptidase SppA
MSLGAFSPRELTWMISPTALPAIVSMLRQRPGTPMAAAEGHASDDHCCGAGGLSMVGPVAVVEVLGPIFSSMSRDEARWYGCTSMEALTATIRRAATDTAVRGGVLCLDCPGGSVPGSEELLAAIAEFKALKPLCALAANMACSLAAFAGAACGEFVAAQNAIVGSVGGIIDVTDWSRSFAAAGVESVALTDQPLKALGIPGQAVTPEMRANLLQLIRDQVAPYMRAFAAARGMTPEDVQALEGGVYAAPRAVQMKLIDRVVSPREFIAGFAARVLTQSPSTVIVPPVSAGARGPESGANARKGASMSTDLASMVAGLAPDTIDTAAAAVQSNAALYLKVGQAFAAAQGLSPAPKPASIAELKSEFKDDMAFVVDAMEQGLTLDAARAQYGVTLRGKLDQASAKIKELSATLATKAASPTLGNPPVKGGEEPAPAATAKGAKFNARIEQHIRTFGGGRSSAVGALMARLGADAELAAEHAEWSGALASGALVEKD